MKSILPALGLMTRAEHERVKSGLDQSLLNMAAGRNEWIASSEKWEAKYKKAVTDRDNWREQALRDEPDALAMRRKRQMDRDRKKGKKEAGK